MQPFNKSIVEIIRQRYSCRSYSSTPLSESHRWQLESYIASACCQGPLGAHPRYGLIAASEGDSSALRGLGTYNYINNPAGFIAGVIGEGEKNLEDFGYLTESIILYATDLGLGTCWLGGSFTYSTFVERFPLGKAEIMPAVVSIGYPLEDSRLTDLVRKRAGSDERLPWSRLFFEDDFNRPLQPDRAGAMAEPLEMVRLGPSASNKQPWRILKAGSDWHFYVQRTPGYRAPRPLYNNRLLSDMQRIDMGIAMCHFELAARQSGLTGTWTISEPPIAPPDELSEYILTWRPS